MIVGKVAIKCLSAEKYFRTLISEIVSGGVHQWEKLVGCRQDALSSERGLGNGEAARTRARDKARTESLPCGLQR